MDLSPFTRSTARKALDNTELNGRAPPFTADAVGLGGRLALMKRIDVNVESKALPPTLVLFLLYTTLISLALSYLP